MDGVPELDLVVSWWRKGGGASAGFGCFVALDWGVELDLIVLWLLEWKGCVGWIWLFCGGGMGHAVSGRRGTLILIVHAHPHTSIRKVAPVHQPIISRRACAEPIYSPTPQAIQPTLTLSHVRPHVRMLGQIEAFVQGCLFAA